MAGPWDKYAAQQGGMQRVGPANPMRPLQVEGAQLGNQRTAQQIQADQTMLPLQVQKLQAELEKSKLDTARAKISPEDQAFLNKMREETGPIGETLGMLRNAEQLTARMNPDTARMAQWGTVQDGGGITDWLGSKLFGGLTTPQQKDDFQNLTALQNDAVLLKQMAQKGPQTESDAVRMQLATLSPYKLKKPNTEIIGRAALNAALAQRKPEFYTRWASRYGGLNATDKKGRTVDQAWRQVGTLAEKDYSRKRSSPKKNSGVKFLGFE